MRNQPDESTETAFTHAFGDYMTGGKYTVFRWIWAVFYQVNTMLLLVFIRKNLGRKVARNGSWLYASFYLLILMAISIFYMRTLTAEGLIDNPNFSAPLFLAHGGFYLVMVSWRRMWAWIRLRSGDSNGQHSYSIGDSVFYPVIRFFLKPLRLIEDYYPPRSWWKLTEDRWMQWIEPLLLCGIGMLLVKQGFTAYGNFWVLSSLCVFVSTFRAYDNTAKIQEAMSDARSSMPASARAEPAVPQHVIQTRD